MIIIGLTGSIGMGKSTTAQMFRDERCPVFDADAAVHDLYAKGGKAVPIIRAVFLESFIHPLVSEARADFFAEHKEADIVVMDVPLLFETGLDKAVHHIVVVTAPYEVQRKRVLAREGMTPELFDSLLARQTPDVEKRKRAHALVFTDKGLDNAREQVQTILRELKSKA